MGTPLRQFERLGGRGLVSKYIEYIGAREPDNTSAIRDGNPFNPFRASLVIGASCLSLVHGKDRTANAELRSVYDNMGQYAENNPSSVHKPAAVILQHIATMILDRERPDAAEIFQKTAHAESIARLKELRKEYRRQNGQGPVGGTVAELAFNSLGTRYAGPGTLTIPALLHHDQGRRRVDNTDIIVVDSSATQRAQLKQFCLGFCGEEGGKIDGDRARSKYMEDVVLASAHCDAVNPDSGQSLGGLTKRLICEARGEATPAQIETLNEATFHVLQTIIDPEPWRMGTQPMARSIEYSFGG